MKPHGGGPHRAPAEQSTPGQLRRPGIVPQLAASPCAIRIPTRLEPLRLRRALENVQTLEKVERLVESEVTLRQRKVVRIDRFVRFLP